MSRLQASQWVVSLAFFGILAGVLSEPLRAQAPGTKVRVTTWQDDTHRTGQNLNEGTLRYT